VWSFAQHEWRLPLLPCEWNRPLAGSLALFRVPVYTLGYVVATIFALGLAPISVVAAACANSISPCDAGVNVPGDTAAEGPR
jgi:hypothetical protein